MTFTLSEDEVLGLMKEQRCSHYVINLESDAVIEGGAGVEVWGVDEVEGTLCHASGWSITGTVTWDYYPLCSTFKASHVEFGDVWSKDLRNSYGVCVEATSAAAFDHFWSHHGSSFYMFDRYDV